MSKESEVKNIEWLRKEFDDLFNGKSILTVGKSVVDEIIDQLDEPETLSQEWIEYNVSFIQSGRRYVLEDRLQNLLVPKQEELEVKIQKLIETYKQEEGAYSNHENGWIGGFVEDLKNLLEEEQKYFAKIKGHENIDSDDKYWNYCITDESLEIGDNKVHADVLAEYVLSATKDDWNNLGINEHNADFVKVEELEE